VRRIAGALWLARRRTIGARRAGAGLRGILELPVISFAIGTAAPAAAAAA
jgi:hypothetical protein